MALKWKFHFHLPLGDIRYFRGFPKEIFRKSHFKFSSNVDDVKMQLRQKIIDSNYGRYLR